MTLCCGKECCCTATPTNQSSANMHFSNTLGWSFEMIHVCKNSRGRGGGGEGFTFWPMDYYEDYLPMSRTKTNRKTDREKYTRSNNATTTLPTLVKLAETLARDWPNTTTRNGDVNNHIVEHHLQMKHQIDWDSATCITYSTDTINDSL